MDLIIDVDGVLRDIIPRMFFVYKKYYDKDSSLQLKDVKLYNIEHLFPKVDNIVEVFFIKHKIEIFYDAKPYKNAVDVINKLYKKHKIHIATHQFRGNENITIEWLKKHGFLYHTITFAEDKTFIHGDILLEDKTSTLIDFRKRRMLPLTSLCCMDQPWNRDWDGYRVKNMLEFFDYVRLSDHIKNIV